MTCIGKLGNRNTAVLLLAILCFISITQLADPVGASVYKQDFLRTQGTWITDSNGNGILLRGANYPGYTECDVRRQSNKLA